MTLLVTACLVPGICGHGKCEVINTKDRLFPTFKCVCDLGYANVLNMTAGFCVSDCKITLPSGFSYFQFDFSIFLCVMRFVIAQLILPCDHTDSVQYSYISLHSSCKYSNEAYGVVCMFAFSVSFSPQVHSARFLLAVLRSVEINCR